MNQVLERGAALPATPVEPYSCIMRHKHEQPEGEALTEAARSAFERVGEQWTDMRAQLFNVIVGLDRPASAYDIADRFSEQRGRRVAANSVYRILDLFVAANIVTRVEVANRYLPNVHPAAFTTASCFFASSAAGSRIWTTTALRQVSGVPQPMRGFGQQSW